MLTYTVQGVNCVECKLLSCASKVVDYQTMPLKCSVLSGSKRSEVILFVTMQSNLVQSVKVKCGGGGGPETNFLVY